MHGVLELPWRGYAVAALAFTHVTIVAVTLFLHRGQAHRALEVHPIVSHFFRLWLWLTTGMKTKEWVAVHRKHHARVETADDPHSPQVHGLSRVLWGGVALYRREAMRAETLERFGEGTPDDWLERNVYSRYVLLGLVLMAAVDLVLFGVLPGSLIFGVQMAWIPFWAAGVINGVGHFHGYRNWQTDDASTNIVPWGILIGGEELHNNHHAYPSSAKLSNRWFEFDLGWAYLRLLEAAGLARVKRVPPTPRFVAPRLIPDPAMLQAVIAHRFHVLASYACAMRRIHVGQVEHLRTMRAMRAELAALWERSMASRDQLLRRLEDWCRRAEASGIAPLVEFSRRLRSYA
ncbi:MAG TPA: fatty acid desaturase [Burkholderiales bacterium]|nr:fatty acid desaturase [Burkholderiales bacterium]